MVFHHIGNRLLVPRSHHFADIAVVVAVFVVPFVAFSFFALVSFFLLVRAAVVHIVAAGVVPAFLTDGNSLVHRMDPRNQILVQHVNIVVG